MAYKVLDTIITTDKTDSNRIKNHTTCETKISYVFI